MKDSKTTTDVKTSIDARTLRLSIRDRALVASVSLGFALVFLLLGHTYENAALDRLGAERLRADLPSGSGVMTYLAHYVIFPGVLLLPIVVAAQGVLGMRTRFTLWVLHEALRDPSLRPEERGSLAGGTSMSIFEPPRRLCRLVPSWLAWPLVFAMPVAVAVDVVVKSITNRW
jgi:hypothetical protein